MTQTNRTAKKPPKMKWKIFGYFALFCAFTIAILWIFQIVLLDRFYQSIMARKLAATAAILSADTDDDGFEEKVYGIAEKTGFCISVYEIKDGVGTLKVDAHVKNTCLIHNMRSNSILNELYGRAKDGDGSVTKRYSPTGGGDIGGDNDAIVLARVGEIPDGERMILVNSEIVPVAATTSTLRIQLLWITGILLAAAALLCVLISKFLARPVSKINDEAKILATESYNVNFDASGYREVAELSDTLNYAASELSKVDRMQKELIANISHDLRTPLTMIAGYSEAMRDIPGEMTPENMQIVIDETRRLTSLVNDVLDLSRITSGTLALRNERFSLTELCGSAMERYAHLNEKDGYDIRFVHSSEVYVFADRTRVLQVLYNLVNNAVNYTGDDKRVTVTQEIRGDAVRISVTDTGEGIPEEKLPLIWERYYKASEYHRRGEVGSGLGLSIVKGILDGYGAHYGVTSKLGCGSTFWFELPISGSPEHGNAAAPDDGLK